MPIREGDPARLGSQQATGSHRKPPGKSQVFALRREIWGSGFGQWWVARSIFARVLSTLREGGKKKVLGSEPAPASQGGIEDGPDGPGGCVAWRMGAESSFLGEKGRRV